jgi:cellobiose phosphorylase
MYVHAHRRYAEATAVLGEAEALWQALQAVNPITVGERLAHASLRQRNAYFSSSDAAFADRYQASAEWPRVTDGTVAVDSGWRIYSSGPGLFTRVLLQQALGMRRYFGERISLPALPRSLGPSLWRRSSTVGASERKSRADAGEGARLRARSGLPSRRAAQPLLSSRAPT